MRNPEAKLLTLDAAFAWREALRERGADLVVTNGCFDLLHRGHCAFLWHARRLGDALLVLLNSDVSVRSLKGPERPLVPELARAYVLASLRAVSAVVLYDTPRCHYELKRLEPDVYAKAGEYNIATLDEQEKAALTLVGARIEFLPHDKAWSTTALIDQCRNR